MMSSKGINYFIAKKKKCFNLTFFSYHLKQPFSRTSNVKLIETLSKTGSKTRG